MKSESRILTVRSRDYDTMLDRVVRLIDEGETRFGTKRKRDHERHLLVDWPTYCRI